MDTAPAENAHMPTAAEAIINFAENIVFSELLGDVQRCTARIYETVKEIVFYN